MRTGKILATAINISSQPLVVYDLDFFKELGVVNFTLLVLFLFLSSAQLLLEDA